MAELSYEGTPGSGISGRRLRSSSTAMKVCLTAACQAAPASKDLHAMPGHLDFLMSLTALLCAEAPLCTRVSAVHLNSSHLVCPVFCRGLGLADANGVG